MTKLFFLFVIGTVLVYCLANEVGIKVTDSSIKNSINDHHVSINSFFAHELSEESKKHVLMEDNALASKSVERIRSKRGIEARVGSVSRARKPESIKKDADSDFEDDTKKFQSFEHSNSYSNKQANSPFDSIRQREQREKEKMETLKFEEDRMDEPDNMQVRKQNKKIFSDFENNWSFPTSNSDYRGENLRRVPRFYGVDLYKPNNDTDALDGDLNQPLNVSEANVTVPDDSQVKNEGNDKEKDVNVNDKELDPNDPKLKEIESNPISNTSIVDTNNESATENNAEKDNEKNTEKDSEKDTKTNENNEKNNENNENLTTPVPEVLDNDNTMNQNANVSEENDKTQSTTETNQFQLTTQNVFNKSVKNDFPGLIDNEYTMTLNGLESNPKIESVIVEPPNGDEPPKEVKEEDKESNQNSTDINLDENQNKSNNETADKNSLQNAEVEETQTETTITVTSDSYSSTTFSNDKVSFVSTISPSRGTSRSTPAYLLGANLDNESSEEEDWVIPSVTPPPVNDYEKFISINGPMILELMKPRNDDSAYRTEDKPSETVVQGIVKPGKTLLGPIQTSKYLQSGSIKNNFNIEKLYILAQEDLKRRKILRCGETACDDAAQEQPEEQASPRPFAEGDDIDYALGAKIANNGWLFIATDYATTPFDPNLAPIESDYTDDSQFYKQNSSSGEMICHKVHKKKVLRNSYEYSCVTEHNIDKPPTEYKNIESYIIAKYGKFLKLFNNKCTNKTKTDNVTLDKDSVEVKDNVTVEAISDKKPEKPPIKVSSYIKEISGFFDRNFHGVIQYDWLETAVDIQSALFNLIGLNIQKKSIELHPDDLALLNYVKYVFETAVKQYPDYVVENTLHAYVPEDGKSVPKPEQKEKGAESLEMPNSRYLFREHYAGRRRQIRRQARRWMAQMRRQRMANQRRQMKTQQRREWEANERRQMKTQDRREWEAQQRRQMREQTRRHMSEQSRRQWEYFGETADTPDTYKVKPNDRLVEDNFYDFLLEVRGNLQKLHIIFSLVTTLEINENDWVSTLKFLFIGMQQQKEKRYAQLLLHIFSNDFFDGLKDYEKVAKTNLEDFVKNNPVVVTDDVNKMVILLNLVTFIRAS